MKHRIFGKKLGRNHNQRQALFRSLVKSIFIHGSITTTLAKAQSVVPIVESLSNTIMVKSDLLARRELFRYLQNQAWVNNVVNTMKEVFAGQTSNFTQITKIGKRFGDDSLMVKLSFVKPVKFEIKKTVEKTTDKPKKTTKPVKKVKKETK